MSRVKTTRFIKRPLYVDAVKITGANFDKVAEWCQGEIQQDEVPGKGTGRKFIRVRVHNPKNPRQTKAFVGDWLLYTERGYKVYTNKAFHASFEEATVGSTLVIGTEEIVPGVTVTQAVKMLQEGRPVPPRGGRADRSLNQRRRTGAEQRNEGGVVRWL
jgi:hypothetical protein